MYNGLYRATFLPVVLMLLFSVSELAAQAGACCRCQNHWSDASHRFESQTCTSPGGGELTTCDVNPHQCTQCDQVIEEGWSSGCHATWTDVELDLSCDVHEACESTSLMEAETLASLRSHLVARQEGEFLTTVAAVGLPSRLVLNEERSAIQLLSCNGASVIGHFPITPQTMDVMRERTVGAVVAVKRLQSG
jgi:hypothetical protein